MDEINLSISNSEIKDLRRLFLRSLAFVPVLLLVAAVNLFIDPSDLYGLAAGKHGMDEYHIAQTLIAGKNVAITGPFNQLLLEKYFAAGQTAAPDIVVLGSSRALWLGENIFPDQKVVNNFVPDAVLPDYLGVFEEYAKRNLYPHRVILFLEPQLTLYPIYSESWYSIKENTYAMLNRIGIRSERIKPAVIPQAWVNALSFSYFQESIKELRDSRDPDHAADNGGGRLLLPDGRSWLAKFPREAGLYNESIKQILRNQSKPDRDLENVLENFIRYLTAHHVQVTLYLLPFHPQLYQDLLGLRKTPGALDIVALENYYRGLAQRLNTQIIGSYDPAACRLQGNDFYDGEHIKNDMFEKILKGTC